MNINNIINKGEKFKNEFGEIITMPLCWEYLQKLHGDNIHSIASPIKLAKLKTELKQIKDKNKCCYFVPCGTAEHFINQFKDYTINQNNIYVNIYAGGNDTQKTTIAVNSIINFTLPQPVNPWFQTNFYKTFRKPTRGRIVADPKTIQEKIVPELKKWLPYGSYTSHKKGKIYESEFIIRETGCVFDLMTTEQDITDFESVDLDWLWNDEPSRYNIVTACLMRLRKSGYAMFTFTPLFTAGFMLDNFINKVDDNIKVTYSEAESNCKIHGIRGIRTHESIIEKMKFLNPLEYDARIKGKFMFSAGLKYPQFNKDIHFIEPFTYRDDKNRLDKNYIIVNVLDPHDRKPFALGWYLVEIVKPYRCYVIEEYPKEPYERISFDGKSTREYALLIKGVEERIGSSYIRFGDPNYGNRHSRRGNDEQRSIFEDLQEAGNEPGIGIDLTYYDVSDNLQVGHKEVQDMLLWKKNENGELITFPRLYIWHGIYNHVYAMTHYRDKEIDPITSKERICEDGKDFADLMRYLAMSRAWLYNPENKYKQNEYKKRGY